MSKILWLMKRKPATSMDDLIDYYESKHAVLGTDFWKMTKLAPKKYMTNSDFLIERKPSPSFRKNMKRI